MFDFFNKKIDSAVFENQVTSKFVIKQILENMEQILFQRVNAMELNAK